MKQNNLKKRLSQKSMYVCTDAPTLKNKMRDNSINLKVDETQQGSREARWEGLEEGKEGGSDILFRIKSSKLT